MKKEKRFLFLTLIMALALVVTACSGAEDDTIRIGSKEFTEQHILANMYALLLEDAGLTVEYNQMGGTSENHQALLEGQIDLYPEYTGTALLTNLEMPYDPSMSGDEVYDTVKEAYAEQFNVVWLDKTSFNNTYCLAVTRDLAEEMGVSTLSELSTMTSDLTFGTVQEFTERDDGLPGLQALYGGFEFAEVLSFDPGLKYVGLQEGEIDVTTCFGTDGQIAGYDLVVLEDDMGFWPPYPIAPVVRAEALEAHPEIADALNQLAPLLDGETMSGLNWEVDGNGREADEVAYEFLVENGLISAE